MFIISFRRIKKTMKINILVRALVSLSFIFLYEIIIFHAGSGNELGLTLTLKPDVNDYFCLATRSFGFKILLHSPNDLPKISNYGIAIPTNYETRIMVAPKLSIASQTIRKISRDIRQITLHYKNSNNNNIVFTFFHNLGNAFLRVKIFCRSIGINSNLLSLRKTLKCNVFFF